MSMLAVMMAPSALLGALRHGYVDAPSPCS